MPGTGKLTLGEQDTESLISIKFNKKRWLLLLSTIGPGVLAASAGNDAGGVASFATAGASYGYAVLWVLLLLTFAMGAVQEMAARMGAVTGKGLSSLIRERFGVQMTFLAMVALLLANTAVVISQFAGIAAAVEILGISKYIGVPLAAVSVWILVVRGSYERVERVLMLIAMLLLTYVAAAIMVKPDWGAVARGLVVPQIPPAPAGEPARKFYSTYVFVIMAIIGTTIAPWMQFFLQSSIVDKGLTMKNFRYARFDAIFGVLVANTVAAFIVVATAAALYYPDMVPFPLHDAADAAKALIPVAGQYASWLFSVGLLGASLLAAIVVPLGTSYAICEAFGWETGVSKDFKEAPAFMGLFTVLIVLSALVVLWPNLPLVFVMIVSQGINGILLPVILIFMLRLVNDKRLMGPYVNGPGYNTMLWGLTGILIILTCILLGTSVWPVG